jgi:hypothetical protein
MKGKIQDFIFINEIFMSIPINGHFYARNGFEEEMFWWIKICDKTAKTTNKKEEITREFMLTEFVYVEKVQYVRQEN